MTRYTTARAQSLKTQADYDRWLQTLSDGDRVLVQEFSPYQNGVPEQWEFWEAVIYPSRGRVAYKSDEAPIKDGICRFWNSDNEWGEVFPARAVPWNSDISPGWERDCFDGHAPAFEPEWSETDRCFVMVEYGPDYNTLTARVRRGFKRRYERDVREGALFTIFAIDSDVEEFCRGLERVKFLYSECLGAR